MMEDVSPKQPRARQTIVTLARNLGYDPLTFAINKSKFLVHEKLQEPISLSKTFKMSFMPMKRLQLTEKVFERLNNQKLCKLSSVSSLLN